MKEYRIICDRVEHKPDHSTEIRYGVSFMRGSRVYNGHYSDIDKAIEIWKYIETTAPEDFEKDKRIFKDKHSIFEYVNARIQTREVTEWVG